MRPVDRRLLPHLAPARGALAGTVAAIGAAGLLVVAQAFTVAALVAGLVRDPAGDDWHRAAVALAVVTVLRALASYAVDLLAERSAATVSGTLQQRLLGTALRVGPHRLSGRRQGALTLLVTRGVHATEPYLTRYVPALAVAVVLPAVTVVAIATQDLLSALIVVLTLPLVPLFAVLVGLTTRDRADRQWRQLGALAGHFVDVVRGLPTLVAHRRATTQAATIRSVTDRYRRRTLETLRLAFASSAVLELVATLSVALVAVTVGLRLATGDLDLQTALTVLLLAPEAYWPLRRLGAEFHAAAEGTAAFEEAEELLGLPGDASGDARTDGVVAPLVLRDVQVTYPDRAQPALGPISATIPRGGLTVVVGPSGSGKSTLLAALARDLPVSAGRILVDGTDLADVDAEAWRRGIAWVPQRPWVMPGTVAENVRLGRPDASDAEVWSALSEVGLRATVAALPGGLDEPVGEDGSLLSAGQRTRLCLARAVVAARPLVVLDEPTAHLDDDTERILVATMRRLAARSTVVAVAHRSAVVEAADHVVRLGPAPNCTEDRPPVVASGHPGAGVAPAPVGPPEVAAPAQRRRRRSLALVLGTLASLSGVALTATAGWLIVRAAEQPPVLMLMVAIVGVRTFGIARPVLRYAERLVSHDVALRDLAEHRARVYDTLVPLVPGRIGRRGDLLSAVVDDVDALVDQELRVRAPVLTAVGVGALTTLFAFLLLPEAGVVVAAVCLGGGLVAWGLAHTTSLRAQPEMVAGRAELSARVQAMVDGLGDVRHWQAGDLMTAEVARTEQDTRRAATRSARGVALARGWVVLTAGAGLVAMAMLGSSALTAGQLSGPVVALLVLLPLALGEVLLPLADAGSLAVRTRAARDRLDALGRTTPAVTTPQSPEPLPAGPGAVRCERAGARWSEDRNALAPTSLDLGPGSRVAVVGPSGSGKSTLAALLLRFLDPVTGRVLLDGTDLRRLDPDDVRRRVGLVDDDPHVFGSSLLENVRLARPDATREEVHAACVAAQLGPWLDGLPAGMDTLLGDGHADVSGGERARIGLARALLADLPVLVLDEPTAHLDTATAQAVADQVLAGRDRSLVWITHGTVGLDRVDAVVRLGDASLPRDLSTRADAAAEPVGAR